MGSDLRPRVSSNYYGKELQLLKVVHVNRSYLFPDFGTRLSEFKNRDGNFTGVKMKCHEHSSLLRSLMEVL